MTLDPNTLSARSRSLAATALEHWSEAPREPSSKARAAVVSLKDAPDDNAVTEALKSFVDQSSSVLDPSAPWAEMPLGMILRALYSAARQALRSPATRSVLEIVAPIRRVAADPAKLCGHPNELLAANMALEDALAAVKGYVSMSPFGFVDEAYVAKYGLLQALQLGFDAAENVARLLGTKIRADRMPGGKTVLATRNIVAGHPIGANMNGMSWLHFHDRASAEKKAMIRVMSFSRQDPTRWTGQTITTDDLVHDGLAVIGELLTRALTAFSQRT